MSWNKIIDERPSEDFRAKVLREASADLSVLSAQNAVPGFFGQRRLLFGTAFSAALAFFITRNQLKSKNETPNIVAEADMLMNVEILNRLDMLEDLDVLMSDLGDDNG